METSKDVWIVGFGTKVLRVKRVHTAYKKAHRWARAGEAYSERAGEYLQAWASEKGALHRRARKKRNSFEG